MEIFTPLHIALFIAAILVIVVTIRRDRKLYAAFIEARSQDKYCTLYEDKTPWADFFKSCVKKQVE